MNPIRAAIALSLALAALGADRSGGASPPSAPPNELPTAPFDETASASSNEPVFENPVIARDCPDPGVVKVTEGSSETFYLACTGGTLALHRSTDLVHWTATGTSILPSGKAPWARDGERNWAPELHAVAGRFVAFFTAANAEGVLAIGAATSASPAGPWTALSQPLVDEPAPGVIDPTFFRDVDGRQYLYWKRDGNAVGQRTALVVRELGSDGLAFAPGSSPREILWNDADSFEGGVVEAPSMVRHDGQYFLFYSANGYDERYRTSVARGPSPLGPFEKLGAPILANNARFRGPGHGSPVEARGALLFVYHAWVSGGSGRQVLVDRIRWEGGWPAIGDGTPTVHPRLRP